MAAQFMHVSPTAPVQAVSSVPLTQPDPAQHPPQFDALHPDATSSDASRTTVGATSAPPSTAATVRTTAPVSPAPPSA
jgi:hypothetical protein